MESILLITFFWPPARGIGVQRWLKLSKYLLRHNVNPIILTVDEKYVNYGLGIDNNLINDVPKELLVYKSYAFNPVRVLQKKILLSGNKTIGEYSLEAPRGITKLLRSIGSNIFIPDVSKGWNTYAIKKAIQIINKHDIRIVITTSPPYSSQLIGLKLKEKLDIKWIADFRDPWTDHRNFNSMGRLYLSKSRNKSLEKKVLNKADKVFTVGDSLKQLLLKKSKNIHNSKICVISNSYDKDDYGQCLNATTNDFNVCYTGTMEDSYEPYVFFNALKEIQEVTTNIKININIIGYITKKIKREILKTGLNCRFLTSLSHKETIKYQKNASILLLVIPNTIHANVILTGKLFEYLATRNNIICIGPKSGDAAKIINECNCGKTFDRTDIQEIKNYISTSVNNLSNNVKMETNEKEIYKYSSEYQAKLVKNEIKNIF